MHLRECFIVTLILGLSSVSAQSVNKSFESISYFPKSVYQTLDSKVDSLGLIHKSILLKRFKETRIYDYKGDSTIFRFTWLPSFEGPMVFTLISHNGQHVLVVKTGDARDILPTYNTQKLNRRDRERFLLYYEGKFDSASLSDIFRKKGFVTHPTPFHFSVESKNIPSDWYKGFLNLVASLNLASQKVVVEAGVFHDGSILLFESYNVNDGYYFIQRRVGSNQSGGKELMRLYEYILKIYGMTDLKIE